MKLNGTWTLSRQAHTGHSNVAAGRFVTAAIPIKKTAR